MAQPDGSDRPKHPIQVAARRSGLTPDVIRAWERRYKVVEPGRSGTNRRLYSDADVERLFILARVTRAGRRIGDVAELSTDELRGLIDDDREAADRVGLAPAPPARAGRATDHLAACMSAIERLDSPKLEAALQAATVDLAPPLLLENLLMPMMREVGSRWQEGTLRVAHEHMATALVRTFLGSRHATGRPEESAPEIVVATPQGQRHELGALMAAVAAAAGGWRVTYLGPDLPAEEIAVAAGARGTRAVALSLVHPGDDPHLPGELRALAAKLPDGIAILVGGSAAAGYAEVLREIDARILGDVESLNRALKELRGAPPAA